MGFVIGLLAFGAALWLLYWVKQRDLTHCREVLGLTQISSAVQERGSTPEGFAFVDYAVLQGSMLGRSARLVHRMVRSPLAPRRQRYGSNFTVLVLTLEHPVSASLRLQPAGMLGVVETLVRGAVTDRVPIDTTFDQAYSVYSDHPAAAMAILAMQPLRERLLAFRSRMAGDMPNSVAAKMASGLVLGSFHVEGKVARYLAFGSPTKATAEQLATAAPILLDLATAAGGR
ncbi:MAG: hypothetical protein H7A17_07655 [Sinobacteraceae bacterium]|nr:hypothetical protein [Nevskiaceae bacterium]